MIRKRKNTALGCRGEDNVTNKRRSRGSFKRSENVPDLYGRENFEYEMLKVIAALKCLGKRC